MDYEFHEQLYRTLALIMSASLLCAFEVTGFTTILRVVRRMLIRRGVIRQDNRGNHYLPAIIIRTFLWSTWGAMLAGVAFSAFLLSQGFGLDVMLYRNRGAFNGTFSLFPEMAVGAWVGGLALFIRRKCDRPKEDSHKQDSRRR